ncbi:MAG: hypothetical protein OXE44_19355 [Nitrospinae bacterium]|nr:hypothetical protein [Nitrospinota bacterium]
MDANSRIEIINPVAAVAQDEGPAEGAAVTGLDGLRIALLDNSMPHAGDFLSHVGEVFAERHDAKLLVHKKGWAAQGAGQETLDEIASNCDVAVTGFGV